VSKQRHIAFFTNTYHPTMSGVVRSISTFRQAFTEMGHNVFIFAQHARDHKDTEPFIFRYPAIEVPFGNQYAFPIPVSPWINEVLPVLKLDVIHSHHPFLLGETAADKAKDLKLPLVFTFHTRYDEYMHYVPFSEKFAKKALIDWLIRYVEKCQHIITPSESIKQMLMDTGVCGPITAIPTGINLMPFQEADGQTVRQKRGWGDDLVLISVGRLGKEKNFGTLIRAAAEVMKAHNNVRLVLIGDGPERKALKELTQDLDIADQVEFTGRIPFEEIPSHLKAADIFCFASVTETQGLVTMEAMAAELPVAAVDAPGTRDAVEDGQEGLLTQNDSAALGQAIAKLVDDEALRQRFKAGVKKRVKWFDREVQAKKMLEVYDQATEDKKANRTIKIEQE
jgi:glycosyltransferase involved in cell wall biosynthesis